VLACRQQHALALAVVRFRLLPEVNVVKRQSREACFDDARVVCFDAIENLAVLSQRGLQMHGFAIDADDVQVAMALKHARSRYLAASAIFGPLFNFSCVRLKDEHLAWAEFEKQSDDVKRAVFRGFHSKGTREKYAASLGDAGTPLREMFLVEQKMLDFWDYSTYTRDKALTSVREAEQRKQEAEDARNDRLAALYKID
jgi:hypothetical protein